VPQRRTTRTKPRARALEAAAAHTCCLRSSVVTRTNWIGVVLSVPWGPTAAFIDVRRWPVRRSPATSDRSSASSPSAVSHLSHPASVPARPPVRVGDRDRGSLPLGTTMAKPLFEGTPFPSRPRRWDLPPPRASSAYNSSWVACIGTNRNSLMLKGGAFVRRNI
jgi:hypothetical protein